MSEHSADQEHVSKPTAAAHDAPRIEGSEDDAIIPMQERERLTARWEDIQLDFVDDPQRGIERADDLVSEVIEQLRTGLDRRRGEFHQRMTASEESTTEQLRLALGEYRSFFDKLLQIRHT